MQLLVISNKVTANDLVACTERDLGICESVKHLVLQWPVNNRT